MPTHAHIMVVGWLSFFVFGFFYHLFGDRVSPTLSTVHFWLAQVTAAGMIVGLWVLYGGNEAATPVAAASAIGYAVSFLVFAMVVVQAAYYSDGK